MDITNFGKMSVSQSVVQDVTCLDAWACTGAAGCRPDSRMQISVALSRNEWEESTQCDSTWVRLGREYRGRRP